MGQKWLPQIVTIRTFDFKFCILQGESNLPMEGNSLFCEWGLLVLT